MKKYCLTYMAAIAALSASAAAPQAERKTDSLHIASLSPREAATIDSIVAMRVRLQPKQIESIFDTNDVVAIDTLDSGNDAIQVVLYSNNTWKYVRNREIAKDSTIFEKYWDTTTLFPYKEVDMSSMPKSVVIDLVDSVTSYHCPYQGSVHPRGKYGPRRRRQHQASTCRSRRATRSTPRSAAACVFRNITRAATATWSSSATTTGSRPTTGTFRSAWSSPTSGSRPGRSSVWAARRGAARGRTCISRPAITGSRSTPSGSSTSRTDCCAARPSC